MFKHCITFSILSIFLYTHVSLEAWLNWSESHECYGEIIYPHTKNELMAVVAKAACAHRNIHVIGAGHSSNDIACSDDLLISLKNTNRILSVDHTKQQVTVEAGITLEAFNQLLAQHNLALPNLISVTETTLAGALCTASHGTGHTGTLSRFCEQKII